MILAHDVIAGMMWWLFVTATPGVQYTIIGPFNTEADCKFVERQMVQRMQPKKTGCIEVPQQKAG